MAFKRNTIEGISNGTTISAANSGGTSGDAFNSVVSTSVTLISDNTHAAHGTQSAKLATTTSNIVSMTWTLTAAGTYFFRVYFWIDSITATTNPAICRLRGTGDTVQAIRVTIDDTRHFQLRNTGNSLISTMTAAFTFSQWNRLEGFCTPGAGTNTGSAELKLFVGDSATPVTNGTLTTSGQNMGSVTNIDAINWGQVVAFANLPAEWMDDFAVSSTAYIGPQVQTLSPASIASAEAFGTATSTPGSRTLSPASIASAEAFGTAFSLPGAIILSPASIPTAQSFGIPTETPGRVTLSPASIPSAETFGTPVSRPGSVSLSPASIPSTEAFGTPSDTPGAATLHPASIGSLEAFGTPASSPGSISLSPPSIGSVEAFGTPSSLPGGVTLFPASIPSAEDVPTPSSTGTLTITLFPPSIDSAERFGRVIAAPISPSGGACCDGAEFEVPCCGDGAEFLPVVCCSMGLDLEED